VAARSGGKPASDRHNASASGALDSDRVLRFAPFINATAALILLAVAVASAIDGRAVLAAVCFFSAAFFILLTFLTVRSASRMTARR
jgi:hypothetical protein